VENRKVDSTLVLWAGLFLLTPGASAQIPDRFTNLQILPKDTSKRELIGTMRGWAGALGVRCVYCHTGGNPDTLEGVDFPSDAKWEKRTARAMLRMVHALNDEHLGRLEPRPVTVGGPTVEALRMDCVICHRGLARPETIEVAMARILAKDGVEAAVRSYRELRTRFLTSGSYDFSERPLNALSERLLAQSRAAEAAALLEGNAEFHPDSAWLHYLLGEARLAMGDRARALASFGRSVALDPQNSRARQRIEELGTPPSPKP